MPELIVKLGDNIVQKYFFLREPMRVGRTPDNEVVIENLAVSRNHSLIDYVDGRYILSDLGSSNGTFVNGVRVNKTEIMDKDVIAIGKHKIYFYDQKTVDQPVRQPTMSGADSTMLVSQSVIEAPLPPAELSVTKGRQKGQNFTLSASKTTIGRGGDNDIRLNDWFISKHHAVIERRGSEYHIVDLGSWRHTTVNGSVIEAARLEEGDEVQLGNTVVLTFRNARPAVRDMAGVLRRPVELQGEPPAVPSPEYAPEYAEAGVGAEEGSVGSAHNRFAAISQPTTMLPIDAIGGQGSQFESTPPPHELADDESVASDDFDDVDGADHYDGASSEHDAEPQSTAEIELAPSESVAFAAEDPAWLAGEEEAEDVYERNAAGDSPGVALDNGELDDLGAAQADGPDAACAPPQYASNGAAYDHSPFILGQPDPEDAVEGIVENLARASVRGAVESATEAHATYASRSEGEASDGAPEPSSKPATDFASSNALLASADGSGARSASIARAIDGSAPQGEGEIAMWERALTNKSAVIRKQAARRLKQLTGRDYDF